MKKESNKYNLKCHYRKYYTNLTLENIKDFFISLEINTNNKIDSMKNKIISRTEAVNLINNSKGRRFTVTYTKQNGSTRTINGSRKNQTSLGNITMVIPADGNNSTRYRTVNPQTISELRINKLVYTVR